MTSQRANRQFHFPITTLLGTSVKNFIDACRGYRFESKFLIRVVLSFIISMVFELLAAWERIFWNKKLKAVRISKPPVFIIGFWRSGTTLLHGLLCEDRDAAYVTTFHTVFPNLVLSQKWLKKLTNFFLPEKRPYDNYTWDMDSPQEEEFAIFNLQPYSFYKFFLFPKDFDRIYNEELPFTGFSSGKKENWKKRYLDLIRKTILDTGGKRYVGKNPCNIYRILTLKEMFPDAKFIFIYRNPYKVVESLYGFAHSIIPGIQLQESSGLPDRERIVKLYCDSMREYFRVRPEIDPENLMEFAYEDMCKDIPGTIRKIYEKFGMNGFEEALPRMSSYLNGGGKNDRVSPQIPPEIYQLLNRYAPDIFLELDYRMEER